MASAFDGLHENDAALIRQKFLAGAKMIDIRKDTGVAAKKLREIRDEIFVPLLTDANAVKELANGPMLNPGSLTRLPYAQSVLRRMKQKAAADALTDEDKAYIRRKYLAFADLSMLAQSFGVHLNTIRAICRGISR